MSEIAFRAHVTTGALYFHFPSKEALALFVMEEQHRISSERASRIIEAGHPAIDTLTHLSASLGFDIVTDPVVKAGTTLSSETQLLPEIYLRPWQDWIRTIEDCLKQGVVELDVAPDTRIEALAQLMGPAFAGVRIASELLHHSTDLLLRLSDLSEAFIPAYATPTRKEAILERSRVIFASYQEKLARWSSATSAAATPGSLPLRSA